MKASIATLTFAMISAPCAALACSPAPPSPLLVREAHAVLVGTALDSLWIDRGPYLLVGVRVDEALRGNAPETVRAISSCALPIQPGERVIVTIGNGRNLVYPADMYEKAMRSGLRVGR